MGASFLKINSVTSRCSYFFLSGFCSVSFLYNGRIQMWLRSRKEEREDKDAQENSSILESIVANTGDLSVETFDTLAVKL